MKDHKLEKTAAKLTAPYRVDGQGKFRLKHFDPADTGRLRDKESATQLLDNGVKLLSRMQEKLYAQNRWSLLIILQAMDAAGKDGVVKHVMSGVNPQGCDVYSFKTPSAEELNHGYLWRAHKVVPARGKIGIFNRSYYEEALVVRVHGKILESQKLPPSLVTKNIWEERFEDMRRFERYLTRNGTIVLKFFLNVSRQEQKKRFLERLEDSKKNWKFSMADVKERGYWKDYQAAYEDMIRNTATKYAPWYVVPADNKWYTRLVVASAIIEALDKLNLQFPDADKEVKKKLQEVKAGLLAEKS
ncbi:MAG: polyphosphate kinase 2 family protein [Acidobacteria bacterium]|nr:polyphosphate kinase 2 family protein [Acidobacteriota bacterium]MBS1865877.1 polyphosphate kinase 2 family protein [Acidobacteriota bacterium]